MIKTLFLWFDRHPDTYWGIALGPTLLLLTWIVSLAWRETRSASTRVGAPACRVGWSDALLLFLFLLAWRWPFLFVADDLNPDESQLIAGAIALTRDPVFWRSVDGNTSGPLNFYALLPLHWLGLPLDYFSARLTGLLLITGALTACLRALAGSCGRAAAWLGVLPAAVFFATITNTDLIHYSSEHVPLLLVAVSFWLLAVRPPADRIRLWTALFIAGSAPWAKLQTVPLALVLIGWGAWQVLRIPDAPLPGRLRRATGAALAALAPTFLAAVLLTATGQISNAVRGYLLHSVFYVGENTGHTMASAMARMLELAVRDGCFPLFLLTALGLLLAAGTCFVIHRVRPPAPSVVGAWLTLSAGIAIAIPHREYLHYLLLLVVPVTFWMGASAGACWGQLPSTRSRRLLALGLILVGGILPLATRCRQPAPAVCGDLAYHWTHPRSSAAVVVHALAGKQDSLAVWGWTNRLYVETGLPQATRDTHSYWAIMPGPAQAEARAIYLADLRRNRPAVFVDAVGPEAFIFNDRSTQGHEIFPELAGYIRRNYALVVDLAEVRIYARQDLATRQGLDPVRLDQLVSQGRLKSRGPIPVPPPMKPLEQYPRKIIDRQNVILLPAPTRMEWLLGGDVRQVTLDFGLDPLAYLQGAGDGAELVLELVAAGQVRPLYRRFLDPARQSGDRGRQNARITLPPYGPDATLVLRTGAGPAGDNAWDWVYLAGLQLHRSPGFLPEQFPGFNRLPDDADALNSAPTPGDDGPRLLMHAPASLAYVLQGREHRLRFAYGFQPGAYTNGGQTDGAIFRVELQQSGAPGRLLFERRLDPARNAADRGTQQLDLTLPTPQKGARLLISIGPGPAGNAAWDWTYLAKFSLE